MTIHSTVDNKKINYYNIALHKYYIYKLLYTIFSPITSNKQKKTFIISGRRSRNITNFNRKYIAYR